VSEAKPQDEQVLRAQLERTRDRLDGLVRDLRVADRELEEVSRDNQQYRLLHLACGALEELSDIGAAELFWGVAAAQDGDNYVRLARGRVDVFQKRLQGIEDKRQELLDEIQLQHETTDFLEDDLYELRRKEEERKLEWIIEREIGPFAQREAVMPWARTGEEDGRFRKVLAESLLLAALLGLLLPLINLPLPDPWEVTEVPERWTSLIRNEFPPPPPTVQEQPKPEEIEPDPEKPLLAEETVSKQTTDETAESKGILAFREKFSGLAAAKAPARLGSDARITSSGDEKTGRLTRDMVTTQAPGSSGGINLASLSRNVGGGTGQPTGVEVARVTSSIAGVVGEDRPLSSGVAAGRTDEEIQIVFDRHKAALYRLYNRELRKDPTLKGQMVLRLTIEPDGSVSMCELQSTDMTAPQLSAQVIQRVRTFDFGAKEDISAVTILYPIDFLPAT